MLICIDGPDKVGKETQSKILAERLQAIRFEYPNYDTPIGQQIERILRGEESFDSLKMQTLQYHNKRADLSKIQAAIVTGSHVVFDRWTPSSFVYGVVEGFDLLTLIKMNSDLPAPDVTIILGGTPFNLDRHDINENVEKQKRVREMYKLLSKPFKWYLVNSKQPAVKVSRDIWAIVDREIERHRDTL